MFMRNVRFKKKKKICLVHCRRFDRYILLLSEFVIYLRRWSVNFGLSLGAETARYIKLHPSSSATYRNTEEKPCGEEYRRPLLSRNGGNYVSSMPQTVINEHITHYPM